MASITRILLFIALLIHTPVSAAPTSNPPPPQAPPGSHQSGGEEHIVIVNKNAPITPQVAEVLRRLDLHESHPDVKYLFNNSAFQGFAASMKSHCLDLLANMTDVSTVEKSVTVSSAGATAYDSRSNAPWGLERISTTSTLSDSRPTAMDYTYTYTDRNLGAGSDIYIVDTGIYTAHNIFGGRAQMIWSYEDDWTDTDGHGTHVSGTAAGAILGVASRASIFGVKSLDGHGGGWSSTVVAGIDAAIQHHDARLRADPSLAGAVISMSLASPGRVDAIAAAVAAAVSAGIHVCAAAGNAHADACDSSPASSGGSHGGAITVGAVDVRAARAKFSNYGDCVDVYAPGVDVVSAWIGAPNMVNSLDGTSMAAPHVTGIIAYAMANNATLARNPALMKEWIRSVALQLEDGTLLANNGVRGGESG